MRRTRIKICGLKRAAEIELAMSLGVDAIGLVFYPPSPRAVSLELAKELLAGVPPFVTVTGLFLNQERDDVRRVVDSLRIDLLQFHGEEHADYCESFARPYIKSIPMGGVESGDASVADYERSHQNALGFLLDSNSVGEAGGTGKTFSWKKMPRLAKPAILAGGLDPGNVAAAIRGLAPYAVDVSSGVEHSRGEKDLQLMRQFVEEVRVVDREHK